MLPQSRVKVPEGQLLHVECLGLALCDPGRHWLGVSEPVAHAYPLGHSVHSSALIKLVALEKLPASQLRGADAPTDAPRAQ